MFRRTFFVLSPSYHGATLLAKLLHAHPEVTALGDTMPSNALDQVCGCGERVSRCPFWQAIKEETGAVQYEGRTRLMLPLFPTESGQRISRLLYSDFTSFWATPGMLRALHSEPELLKFRSDFEALTQAIYRHTPRPGVCFVDGVKSVSRLEALIAAGAKIDGIIHLYRAPVDFVASSVRNTSRGGLTGLVEHALRYRNYHARARQASRHLGCCLDLCYDDLAQDIDRELARLFRFMDVERMRVEELSEHFGQTWHFMGNASLFKFDGIIRPSRHRVSERQRTLIERIAGRQDVAC